MKTFILIILLSAICSSGFYSAPDSTREAGSILGLEGSQNFRSFYRINLCEMIFGIDSTKFYLSYPYIPIAVMKDDDNYRISMNSLFTLIPGAMGLLFGWYDHDEGSILNPMDCIKPTFYIQLIHLLPNTSILYPLIDNHLFIKVGQNLDYFLFSPGHKIYYENNIGFLFIISRIFLKADLSKSWLNAYQASTGPYLRFGIEYGFGFKIKQNQNAK